MLEHLVEKDASTYLEQTMNRVLKSSIKTRDLGETANTLEVARAMIAALRFARSITRVLYRHG